MTSAWEPAPDGVNTVAISVRPAVVPGIVAGAVVTVWSPSSAGSRALPPVSDVASLGVEVPSTAGASMSALCPWPPPHATRTREIRDRVVRTSILLDQLLQG